MRRCPSLLSLPFLVLLLANVSVAQSVNPSPTPSPEICDPEKVCPRISVSCPSASNLSVEFTVSMSGGDPNAKPTYNWKVSSGVITEGQGTSTIKVGLDSYQTVTATLRVGGFDPICPTTASCSTGTHLPAPPAQKIDSYESGSISNERAKLRILAEQLLQQPGSQGYVLFYSDRRGASRAARAAAERAKAYLVKEHGTHVGRIVIVEGGQKEKLTVELWIAPMGSTPPKPEPTIAPPAVKPTKSPVQ